MSDETIALLKSLALRPSRQIAPSVQPMLEAMAKAGCVSLGSAGWIATEQGCALIEQERANARPGRNQRHDQMKVGQRRLQARLALWSLCAAAVS